jgi:hypothetical protein
MYLQKLRPALAWTTIVAAIALLAAVSIFV